VSTQEQIERSVSPEQILQVGLGFWGSRTLLSAVDLGLFTELATKPATADELRARLALHPRSARDFFDALVALGFLERADGVYTNTAATGLFLDRNKPSYVGGILEMAGRRLFGFWNNLNEGLRSGQPQNEVKAGGSSMFAELYADPERLQSFLGAMTGISHGANMAIAAKFPWDKHQTFVDVGTAQGDLAVQVALKNPALRGMGFDLAVVKPIFEAYAQKTGVAGRLTFVAGDFFADPLPAADVVMMGHILHDWDLAQKRMLVRKAYEALPSGGAFIVYESIIDDDRRQNVFGLLMSLNMLIETPGGFDYTGADCIGWMKDVGFKQAYVEHLVGPDSMVVGLK
jgi:hypothetical protein